MHLVFAIIFCKTVCLLQVFLLANQLFQGEEEARQQLSELLEHRDPLQPLHEQEKEQMWAMRFDISTSFRNSLPRLLSCLRWNVHADVAQVSMVAILEYVRM